MFTIRIYHTDCICNFSTLPKIYRYQNTCTMHMFKKKLHGKLCTMLIFATVFKFAQTRANTSVW